MNSLVIDAYLDELLADVPVREDAAMTAVAIAVAPEPAPLAAVPAAVPAVMPTEQATAVARPASFRDLAATTPLGTHSGRAVSSTSRWLRIGIGRDHYAFELLRVQEVVRVAPIVAMRGATVAVLGVMNLRGRIVPVFDLGRWLGGSDVCADEHSRIVVIERDDELIGVLVTVVEDVATLGRDQIEPPLVGNDAGAIVGIARVGSAPTVLLDANALFG